MATAGAAAAAQAEAPTVAPAVPGRANIVIVAGGDSPELSVLERLPPGARCVDGGLAAPRRRHTGCMLRGAAGAGRHSQGAVPCVCVDASRQLPAPRQNPSFPPTPSYPSPSPAPALNM